MSEEENISQKNIEDQIPKSEFGNENMAAPVENKPTESQTSNIESKTENMEVHHHTPTQHKHFKHYLFDFFMLFFAVTAGFFVENFREHLVEKSREKQFIRSIGEDLKQDIYNLDSLIKSRQNKMIRIDSLTLLLKTPDPDEHGNELYYYARWLTYQYRFINNDRTIQQLKNGGNLRLISSQQASNNIIDYDQQMRWIASVEEREDSYILDYIKSLQELFDSGEFDKMLDKKTGFLMPTDNPRLLSKEKSKLQKFLSIIHFLKSANIFILNWTINQEKRAHSTLDFINKEYHLQ